ncbi:hypothetical protein FACS189499_00440 [Clostridia bacterium]|nr:hypothetical protein FACS189499_00440 [Clostridia bacterium]
MGEVRRVTDIIDTAEDDFGGAEANDNAAPKPVVLAVDDAMVQLMNVQMTLASYFDVKVASSAKMGMAVLKRKPVNVKAIICDVEMPDIDGFGFLDEVAKDPELAKIPVIMLTAHTSSDFIFRAKQHGVKYYLKKPYKAANLQEKILKVIDGAKSDNFDHGLAVVEADKTDSPADVVGEAAGAVVVVD